MPEIKSYVHVYIVYSKTFANNTWRKNLNLPLHLRNLFFSRSACATASDFNNKTNFIKVKVKVQVQAKKKARRKTSRNFALSVPLTMFIKINETQWFHAEVIIEKAPVEFINGAICLLRFRMGLCFSALNNYTKLSESFNRLFTCLQVQNVQLRRFGKLPHHSLGRAKLYRYHLTSPITVSKFDKSSISILNLIQYISTLPSSLTISLVITWNCQVTSRWSRNPKVL